MKITITLSDVEAKALAYVAYDPQEWIENFVKVRCTAAIDEIFNAEVQRMASEGGTLSGTKEQVVLASKLLSAKEITDLANSTPPPPVGTD